MTTEATLSSLYERQWHVLYATALRMLSDPEDAREVVQEAFLYAWRKAESFDPSRSSAVTWLSLITRSRSVDHLRRRQHRDRIRSSIEQEKRSAHSHPKGFERIVRRERNDRLRRAMGRLPEAQKRVLELSFFRGLTHRQIAAEVGIPLGTVKTRSALAMEKLHLALTGRPRAARAIRPSNGGAAGDESWTRPC